MQSDMANYNREQKSGGESGIRTHGSGATGTHDFQSCPFGQLGHLSAAICFRLSAISFLQLSHKLRAIIAKTLIALCYVSVLSLLTADCQPLYSL